jgi:hypothetical protein
MRMKKSSRTESTGHVARIRELNGEHKALVENSEGKESQEKHKRRWEKIILK